MLVRLMLAGVLLAHAAIHVAFIAPPPPATAGGPSWPFRTDDSWLLTRLGVGSNELHLVALALVALTIGAFGLAALIAVGIAPAAAWMPAIAAGAMASLALLITFFHPWLVLGVAIDLAVLWFGLVVGWTPTAAEPGL